MGEINLGQAYIQIMPSAKGITNNIQSELNKVMPKIAKDGSKLFDKNFNVSGSLIKTGKGLKSLGKSMTTHITKPILGVGTVLGGLALFKGFNRVLDIDTAKAKLKGLGHDTKNIELIMKNALASVKGTAFGLGEAATTAANAVAAGIKPGKELERHLKLVGDAAAIAGTPLNDMGSIFNKVATSGKVSMLEINQISDRGVPIIQMLGKAMGVADDEIRGLVSSGKIGLPELQKAVEDSMGSAAKTMGELSTAASWENLKAAVSRLGASFLGAGDDANSFFGQLQPLFSELIGEVDSMSEVASKLGQKFGEAFKHIVDTVRDGINWYRSLSDESRNLLNYAVMFAAVAGPLVKVLGNIFKISGDLGNLLPGILGSISGVGLAASGVFIGLGALYSAFGNQIEDALKLVSEKAPTLIKEFLRVIKENLPKIVESGATFISTLIETIAIMLPDLVNVGIEIVMTLANSFIENLPLLIDSTLILIQSILETIIENLPIIIVGAFQIISTLATALIENLPTLLTSAIELVGQFLDKILEILPDLFQAGIDFITNIFNGLSENGPSLLEKIGEIILSLLENIIESLPKFLDKGLEIISSIITGIGEALPDIIDSMGETLGELISTIIENLPEFISKGFELIASLVEGLFSGEDNILSSLGSIILDLVLTVLRNLPKFLMAGLKLLGQIGLGLIRAVPKLLGMIPGIIGSILRVFGTIFSKAINIGKDIVKGIWKGISDFTGWIVDKVKGFASSILGGIKGFLGIKSPSRIMRDEVGHWIPEGLAVGIEDNMKPIKNAVDEMGELVTNDFEADVTFGTNMLNAVDRFKDSGIVSMKDELRIDSNVSLNIGGRNFKAFVEDITNQQEKENELVIAY